MSIQFKHGVYALYAFREIRTDIFEVRSFLTSIYIAFFRITGLMRSGQLKWEERPLWYDAYVMFPPFETPIGDKKYPKHKETVPDIKELNIDKQNVDKFGVNK